MVGSQISHYIIESELGRGGMGVVYKAKDTTLDRIVALKFLPPMIGADSTVEARFINEAKAVSQLDHPNIAVVHEIDRTDDGQLFIVMAYYKGQTLEEKIEEGDLTFDEIVEITTQIASGLHRAHNTGIIHRDIKPANVMITEHGELKILDFGLAKIQNMTLTVGGQSLGTLAYMSPEQAQGQPVDHRTDLWALGVVMYEMIAGKRPFEGPYDAAILYSAANEDAERLNSLNEAVPEYLEELVNRLLEKKPENRVQTAAEVLATLEQQQAPTPSRIKAVSEELKEEPKNDRAGSSHESEPKGKSPASVTINLDTAAIARKPWLWVSLVGVLFAVGLFWIYGVPGSGGGTGDDDREAARAHLGLAIEHQNNRRYSLAEAEYQRATERDPDLWSVWSSYASLKNDLQEYDKAAEYARRAIDLNENDAVAYFNLAIALEDSGNREEAYLAFAEAIRADGMFTEAYSAWGNTLIKDGKQQDAVEILERGMAASPDDARIFLIYRNLGFAHSALGNPDDSILYLESSLQIAADQPVVVAELAEAYTRKGDVAAARQQWTRFLEIETDPIRRREAQQALNAL